MFQLNKYFSSLSPTKKKVALNLYWATLGKVVSMLGSLFVGILVARYLGPNQYGLMNYVISYVAIFSILSSFGLDSIEIRELSRWPDRKNIILGTCFRIRLVFSMIAYVLIIISLYLFKADLYTSLMIVVYALCLFISPFTIIRNYFTSIVQNEYVVKSEIYRTLIGAVIKIILLWLNASLFLFIVATVLDFFIVSAGYIVSYRKKIGSLRDWRYVRSQALFFIKESFPLVLSGAAVIIYSKIDQVMIKNMIDNESLGFFATASKFTNLILFIPLVLVQTITPLLVKERKKNYTRYQLKKQQFVSIVTWISIILACIVFMLSYYLISFTYGEKYLMAVPVLQIMIFKTVGMALSNTSGQIMIIEHIQKWAVMRNLAGCAVCIILNYLLIPKYGITGAAAVTIITVFVSGFLINLFIPPYRDIFRIQLKSLLLGWKDLLLIKRGLK